MLLLFVYVRPYQIFNVALPIIDAAKVGNYISVGVVIKFDR